MAKTPDEHVKVNQRMRDAFRAHRFSADDTGRILRGPTGPDTEDQPVEDAPVAMSPGRADGGATGSVPQDPLDGINRAIRRVAGGS